MKIYAPSLSQQKLYFLVHEKNFTYTAVGFLGFCRVGKLGTIDFLDKLVNNKNYFVQECVKDKEEQCANFRQLLLEKEEEIMQLEQVLIFVSTTERWVIIY